MTGDIFTWIIISVAEKKGTNSIIPKKGFKTMCNCDYEQVAPVIKKILKAITEVFDLEFYASRPSTNGTRKSKLSAGEALSS